MNNCVSILKFLPQESKRENKAPIANAFLSGPLTKNKANKAKNKTLIPT